MSSSEAKAPLVQQPTKGREDSLRLSWGCRYAKVLASQASKVWVPGPPLPPPLEDVLLILRHLRLCPVIFNFPCNLVFAAAFHRLLFWITVFPVQHKLSLFDCGRSLTIPPRVSFSWPGSLLFFLDQVTPGLFLQQLEHPFPCLLVWDCLQISKISKTSLKINFLPSGWEIWGQELWPSSGILGLCSSGTLPWNPLRRCPSDLPCNLDRRPTPSAARRWTSWWAGQWRRWRIGCPPE